MINQIKAYVKHHNLKIDPEAFAQLVVGLLLRYAIMEEIPTYHLLNEKRKTILFKPLHRNTKHLGGQHDCRSIFDNFDTTGYLCQ